jgi:hypothetical protein
MFNATHGETVTSRRNGRGGEFDLQTGSGVPPHAVGGGRGHAQGRRGFVACQSQEEPEFHESGMIRFGLCEFGLRFVECQWVLLRKLYGDIRKV